MIAALYSSQPHGSKAFEINGQEFGWETIESIFKDEMNRAEMGLSREVPGLRYAYVFRDNWTRLNVLPAKIMQVLKLNKSTSQFLDLIEFFILLTVCHFLRLLCFVLIPSQVGIFRWLVAVFKFYIAANFEG